MNIFTTNLSRTCPGGFCDYIADYSEVLVVILCLDGFIFFVTLLPPLFSWSNKKADGRKRIYFAALACFTFYFWLAFLAVNSLYCFGFLAHQGPCKKVPTSNATIVATSKGQTPKPIETIITNSESFNHSVPAAMSSTSKMPAAATKVSSSSSSKMLTSLMPSVFSSPDDWTASSSTSYTVAASQQPPSSFPTKVIVMKPEESTKNAGVPMPMALFSWNSDKANSSCVQLANEHETQLKNLTLVNILIFVVLFIVFIANAREAMTAKALYHKETLCKREEVQRFLSSLVLKPPEVGHLINCFHMAKTTTNKKTVTSTKKDAGPPRKVVKFSSIENFTYQTWRDFSDHR